jgi:hypothetical protein
MSHKMNNHNKTNKKKFKKKNKLQHKNKSKSNLQQKIKILPQHHKTQNKAE